VQKFVQSGKKRLGKRRREMGIRPKRCRKLRNGAPGVIRTPDLLVRSHERTYNQ